MSDRGTRPTPAWAVLEQQLAAGPPPAPFHPSDLEATGWRTFGGVTVPCAGVAGWHHGTDRWEQGQFIRYEITDYALVGGGTSGC